MKITSSLASKRNSKRWWSAVKCLIGRGGHVSNSALNVSGKFITNNKDKASVLSKYFLSHSTINTNNALLPVKQINPIRFDHIFATEAEVTDQIKEEPWTSILQKHDKTQKL